jgi:hypothetical protein
MNCVINVFVKARIRTVSVIGDIDILDFGGWMPVG